MQTPPRIRIFLSSPGDVNDERALVQRVVDELAYDPLLRGKATFELVAWDAPQSSTPMLASVPPQEAINLGMPLPRDCEIVVVIFWARMGTPLPHPDYAKPDGTPFLSGTEWEYLNALEAAHQTGSPALVVYRRTEAVLLDPDDPHFEDKLNQQRRVKAFFAAFQNPDGSLRQGYNSYSTPEDFRVKVESHLRSLVRTLLERSPAIPNHTPTLWQGSPFPGLRPFTERDAPIFFGRGRETDDLLQRVQDNRFVGVAGASGSGKSSLVWAGLIPRLRANAIAGSKDWRIVRMTPASQGDNPLWALGAALGLEPSRIMDDLPTLWANQPAWAEVFLFIDQFEELLTQVHPRHRLPFVNTLEAMLVTQRVRVVITVRADFYHRLIELEALALLLQQCTYPLAAPGAAALVEMIRNPAARAGLEFEAGLVERILFDTGQEPGALALLAYALQQLYDLRTPEGHLTRHTYLLFGGVQGAIGQQATQVYESLPSSAQAQLPQVFHRLVEIDERGTPTRRIADLATVTTSPAATQLVEALTTHRLLVHNQRADGTPTLEVAHEALFRSWAQLAGWIETAAHDLWLSRELLREAEAWFAHQADTSYLRRGGRLDEAVAWLARFSFEVEPLQRGYITAGLKLRQSEQTAEEVRRQQELEQERRRRRLVELESARRGQLGRLLHDGPAQQLTNVILQLEIVKRLIDRDQMERALQEFAHAIPQASRVFQQVRDFIAELTASERIGTDGFRAALVGVLRRLEARYQNDTNAQVPPTFDVYVHDAIQPPRVPLDLQVIALELLVETVRVLLYLVEPPTKPLALRIEVGIEKDNLYWHAGDPDAVITTSAITRYLDPPRILDERSQERLALVDGTFDLDYHQGVAVELTIPLSPLDTPRKMLRR